MSSVPDVDLKAMEIAFVRACERYGIDADDEAIHNLASELMVVAYLLAKVSEAARDVDETKAAMAKINSSGGSA